MTDEPAKPSAKQSDEEILKEARERYKACSDADGENIQHAREDLIFLQGGLHQWDARAVANRERMGRPIITVNDLPAILHQVTNDQRMNTPSIKVHPVGDGADVESAKVRQGIIRHIEYASNADVAYDTAVNSAAAIGFGYFRVITDYEAESSFDQCIMFQRIRNALSVKMGPHVEPDGSDCKFCFVEVKLPKDEFQREYPKAEACDTTVFANDSQYSGWISDIEVLVCDYYRIETEDVEVVLLSDGSSGFKDKLVSLPEGITVVKTRPGVRSKVMLYKITATDILDRTEIKCKWIPVFPVYGDELDIDGKIVRSGIVRHAKGPAQMYNVSMTSAVEDVTSRNISPYIVAEGQIVGNQVGQWANANTVARPYLTYTPTTFEGNLVPAPARVQPADIPSGLIALANHAQDNKKKVTGLYNASLGAKGTATSGIQEKAQQQEGDVANFHYADSLNQTIRHVGRCLNCMIPNYYDTQRVVKIMGDDDELSHAEINAPNVDRKPDQTGAIREILNDMTCGDFDVTVSAGPSFSTMRQENVEFFTSAMQAAKDPATAAVVTYLAMKNQDAPGAEEAVKMLKTLLPPPAAAVLDEGKGKDKPPDIMTPKGPLPVAQVPQVLQQLEGQIQQMGEQLQKIDMAKQQAEASRQQAEVLKQQHLMAEQQLEPQRIQAEMAKNQAALASAQAANVQAQADLLRAQREAATPPAVERQPDPAVELLNAQAAATSAEAARISAQAALAKANVESQLAPQHAQIELTRAAAEQHTSMKDRAQVEAERMEAAKPPAPTIQEIMAAIEQAKPKLPPSLNIRAPSGQVYTVEIPTLQ